MDAQAAIALVRTSSLSSLVEAAAMRLTLSGELQARQQINAIAIASRLGMGRWSLREALRGLEAAGLVRAEKNRGGFILKPTARAVAGGHRRPAARPPGYEEDVA
jgi:DNA-binding GntR family transcriptional regulator